MAVTRQREKRLALQLPLEVNGEEATGLPFADIGRSLNISAGGICFETRRNLLVGGRLLLSIQLPEPLRKHFGGRAVYRARAVVCRVERNEGEVISRIGARFLGEAEL